MQGGMVFITLSRVCTRYVTFPVHVDPHRPADEGVRSRVPPLRSLLTPHVCILCAFKASCLKSMQGGEHGEFGCMAWVLDFPTSVMDISSRRRISCIHLILPSSVFVTMDTQIFCASFEDHMALSSNTLLMLLLLFLLLFRCRGSDPKKSLHFDDSQMQMLRLCSRASRGDGLDGDGGQKLGGT